MLICCVVLRRLATLEVLCLVEAVTQLQLLEARTLKTYLLEVYDMTYGITLIYKVEYVRIIQIDR